MRIFSLKFSIKIIFSKFNLCSMELQFEKYGYRTNCALYLVVKAAVGFHPLSLHFKKSTEEDHIRPPVLVHGSK